VNELIALPKVGSFYIYQNVPPPHLPTFKISKLVIWSPGPFCTKWLSTLPPFSINKAPPVCPQSPFKSPPSPDTSTNAIIDTHRHSYRNFDGSYLTFSKITIQLRNCSSNSLNAVDIAAIALQANHAAKCNLIVDNIIT
jgi:hypothetical protein